MNVKDEKIRDKKIVFTSPLIDQTLLKVIVK